ncbi:hypothetical protein C8024_05015 [Sphingopyxis sp. BSNA05]|uniref:AAA family ATPase n=1 Tax=Sphingopyxis sp. BSNA05 TaxID=1236614 RepID=UPI001565F6C7|nr:AAA family ATPase [Sphingopyxis sp. BSNA05]NRD88953.1 hypothetical protein [Sphingopyxis sp. BSNA05]
MDSFDASLKLNGKLARPIFVENGIQAFSQWLMAVLLETLRDEQLIQTKDGVNVALAMRPPPEHDGAPLWQAANQLLKAIVRDGAARFVWFGRNQAQKIGIDFGDGRHVNGLDALSSGQASLLLIFGTLLRYADSAASFSGLENIKGICVVDEIDSHLHIELQTRVLPELIALFPNVQFIMSSHSPLFALAMEKRFGPTGMRHFDLDVNAYTSASAFSEFAAAFEAIAETEQFEKRLRERAKAQGKPLILLEGETDPLYICRAAEALGKTKLLDGVELQWVGEKLSGNATNTGKDALKHANNMLRSNPNLTNRPILLLYDCDTNKPPEDIGNLHVRSIPENNEATIAKDGIENLLPDDVFEDDMYDSRTKDGKYGNTTIIRQLNKTRLCNTVCDAKTDVATFSGFKVVFEIIEELFPLAPIASATV